ncbi:pentapeptide repeat-containing protein, partial [Nocardia fusca]
ERANFSSGAWFEGATFSGPTRFDEATFCGPTRFDEATFSGDASFLKVNFGTETISFASPKQWGPPTPVFDWNQGASQKPANVEPQDLPPAIATAA